MTIQCPPVDSPSDPRPGQPSQALHCTVFIYYIMYLCYTIECIRTVLHTVYVIDYTVQYICTIFYRVPIYYTLKCFCTNTALPYTAPGYNTLHSIVHYTTLHSTVICSSTVQPEFLPSSQAVRAVATTDMEKLTRAAGQGLEEAQLPLLTGLGKGFFCSLGKQVLFTLFMLILAHFWCSVVTSVTLSSNIRNFENNPTNPNKCQKKSHISKNVKKILKKKNLKLIKNQKNFSK